MPDIGNAYYAVGIVTSLLGLGVIYGMLSAKVERLKEEHQEMSSRIDSVESRFVTMSHFDAVVKPMQDSVREIERDIKKILVAVSRPQNSECE